MARKMSTPRGVRIYLRIRPARICWLKYILEAYDGLAVLSTISVQEGLVSLWTPEHNQCDLWALLGELSEDLTPYPTRHHLLCS
ncbi:MAG: hypothetical protein CSA33_03980 [Desulfobulbus propionicus]|nr:MAG: hypothetical protein CSA33_03980 [Desulfobulbus propionicus]